MMADEGDWDLDALEMPADIELSDDSPPPRRSKTADPLAGVDYTGKVEADSQAEMSAMLKGFAARKKRDDRRFADATDSKYWVAVCFQTRAQKEAFLKAMDWAKWGDKYLDGSKIAAKQGIELPPAEVRYPQGKPDKMLGRCKRIKPNG
jgi:hypothetical protein